MSRRFNVDVIICDTDINLTQIREEGMVENGLTSESDSSTFDGTKMQSIREGKNGVFAVSIGSRVASMPLAFLLVCMLAWDAY